MKRLCIGIFFIALSFFLWSFTLTDPNLLYSSNLTWVSVQNTLWLLGGQFNGMLKVWWYGINMLCAYMLYVWFLKWGSALRLNNKEEGREDGSRTVRVPLRFTWIYGMTMGGILLLVFSNPALSHDLFNYLFNAKAVVVYNQNPHILSALQVAPNDIWVRFMHNVHTPAPYGYGWTVFSLTPFIFGLGKFVLTFLSFKIFMLLGLAVLFVTQKQLLERISRETFSTSSNNKIVTILSFFLNPLVLVETLLNGHNDVWMMVFAFGSFLSLKYASGIVSLNVFLSILLLFFSIQIKMATVVLVPIWVALLLIQVNIHAWFPSLVKSAIRLFATYWADISAVLLFIPLLTDRSQQFHPWYLIWSLSFLPFMQSMQFKRFIVLLSVTSMLRYVPFLIAGEYSTRLLNHSKLITWSAAPLFVVLMSLFYLRRWMISRHHTVA